eukprot:gene29392-35975_t
MRGFGVFASPRTILGSHHRIALMGRFRYCVSERRSGGIVYVASKGRKAKECGFHSVQHTLPEQTSEDELVRLVETLNADPAIHGILVQLPLPKHIDSG